MNVVWVTPQRPSPSLGAGATLEFELLRLAARSHNVHVISSALDEGEHDDDLAGLDVRHEGVTWQRGRQPRNRLGLLWELAARDASKAFFRLGDRLEALSRALERYESAHPVDVVHVMLGETAPVLSAARAPATLLLFDSYTRMATRELENVRHLRHRVAWFALLNKLKRWERHWYSHADGIACNSPIDADAIEKLLSRPCSVVANPVGARFFEPSAVPRATNVVTFVASLNYSPNVDAVEWLRDEIWPEVIRLRPDARLKIAGRGPALGVPEAADEMGASLYLDVPDVRPFYWEAAVALAPIRLGAGLRNKVLHAMACGAPIVATRTAIEGFEFKDDRHLVVADDARSFAHAIVSILDDPDSAGLRAGRARDLVRSFHVEAVAGTLDDWWRQIATQVQQST